MKKYISIILSIVLIFAVVGMVDTLTQNSGMLIVQTKTGEKFFDKQEKIGISVGGGFRKTPSRDSIQKKIKETEGQQAKLRNKRQMAQQQFQSSDQRAQQQYNQMTSILKTMNEQRALSSRGII